MKLSSTHGAAGHEQRGLLAGEGRHPLLCNTERGLITVLYCTVLYCTAVLYSPSSSTVGSSLKTSSPTSAAAIAALIASFGLNTTNAIAVLCIVHIVTRYLHIIYWCSPGDGVASEVHHRHLPITEIKLFYTKMSLPG